MKRPALRDLVVPRLTQRRGVLEAPRMPAPPWPAPDGGAPATLETARFEHAGQAHRVHLRVHGDGSGLVVADAARIAPLDPPRVATLRAWMARLPAGEATDVAALESTLWGEPVLTGSGPVAAFNAWTPAAGARDVLPDVPLVATLEVPTAPSDAAATLARVSRLAALAIPHVVLRPLGEGAQALLLDCVRAAEDAGLVTGVAAPADFVDDGRVLEELAQRGLDHLALVLAGEHAATHDAVLGLGEHAKLEQAARRAARLDVPLTAEIPLVAGNWPRIGAILAAAPQLGVRGATCWALVGTDAGVEGALAPPALRQVATTLEHAADAATLPVTWAAPQRTRDVRRDVLRGPRTDGDFGVRVLADGAGLAPRGPAASAGSLESSSWAEIRRSPAWQAFLVEASRAERCAQCPGLAACAAGCPARQESWT